MRFPPLRSMSQYDDHGHIPDDTYLVIRDGRTSSPRTLEQLVALAEAGKLKPDDELVQRVMGGSIPIGSAGEQPWFPGNAPPDLSTLAPPQDSNPVRTSPSLGTTLMSPEWKVVRIGAVAAILAGAVVAVLLVMYDNRRAERAAREESAAYARSLDSRYQSIRSRLDKFLSSPSDAHSLVKDIDGLASELSRPQKAIPKETRDLQLVLAEFRAEVWNSPSRVKSDITAAVTFALDAKQKFANDDQSGGAISLATAEQAVSTIPPVLPSGIIPETLEAAQSGIASAKSERASMEARLEQRRRADAKAAEELALAKWASRDERAYCECLAEAVKQVNWDSAYDGRQIEVRSIATHNAAAGWKSCTALVRFTEPCDAETKERAEWRKGLQEAELLLTLADGSISMAEYNKLMAQAHAAFLHAIQPRVWQVQLALTRDGLRWQPEGEFLVDGTMDLNNQHFSAMIERIFSDGHDDYQATMVKTREIALFRMQQAELPSTRDRR